MQINNILTNPSILPDRLFPMRFTSISHVIFLIFFSQFVNCNYLTAQDFPTPIVGNDLVKSGVTNASPGKGISVEYFLHPSYNLNNNFAEKIANSLIGKESNPAKENILRQGKIFFERDESKSFINNWWKAMQSGIKSTVLPNILLSEELESTAKE